MMSESIDAGDVVRHNPTGEKWTVAGVDGDQLMWLGWPEGSAKLSDCVLLKKASPAERVRVLVKCAQISGSDIRKTYAQNRIAADAKKAIGIQEQPA